MDIIKNNRILKCLLIIYVLLRANTVYATTYEYDDLGRLIKVMEENGTVMEYSYDEAGNQTTVRVSGGDDGKSGKSPSLNDGEKTDVPGSGTNSNGNRKQTTSDGMTLKTNRDGSITVGKQSEAETLNQPKSVADKSNEISAVEEPEEEQREEDMSNPEERAESSDHFMAMGIAAFAALGACLAVVFIRKSTRSEK